MVLPNFLIIGAPKAGTSSLYAYLKQHPEIYMSPVKEPHYFMLNGKKKDFRGPGDQQRLSSAIYAQKDYEELFSGVTNQIAIGEASTTYLASKIAAEQIKKTIPNAKIIAILRSPIDAAYASFLHLLRDGEEQFSDFSSGLRAEQERIQNNWGFMWHYTQRNFYYEQVKQYFDLFGKDQIKIYLHQDFKKEPQKILVDIFDFLNVETSFKVDMTAKHNVSAMPKSIFLNKVLAKPNLIKATVKTFLPPVLRNSLYQKVRVWNLNNFDKPTISKQDKEHLREIFKEDISKLETLIERDLSNWIV